jgi:hypothetical protein
MRLLKTISLISLFFYLPLYADEVPSSQEPLPLTIEEIIPIQESETVPISDSIPTIQEPTLEELISQVKNAPDDQKRVLMNQLKVHLKSMNKESRQKTMMELKKSFSQKGTNSQEKQQSNQDASQHPTTHQPKYRHLQQGLRDGSGPHRGEGQRGQGAGRGSGQQGNGQK